MTAGADELWSPFAAPGEDGGRSTPPFRALPVNLNPSALLQLRSLEGCEDGPARKFDLPADGYVNQAMSDYICTLLARESWCITSSTWTTSDQAVGVWPMHAA